MRVIFSTLFFAILLITKPVQAQEMDYFDLNDYKWKDRVLLIFSPNTFNSDYREMRKTLKNSRNGMRERDLIVFYALRQRGASTKGKLIPKQTVSDLRESFNLSPSDFTVILIGKDGTEKLRRSESISASTLFDEVDEMPMRRLEMKKKNEDQ